MYLFLYIYIFTHCHLYDNVLKVLSSDDCIYVTVAMTKGVRQDYLCRGHYFGLY